MIGDMQQRQWKLDMQWQTWLWLYLPLIFKENVVKKVEKAELRAEEMPSLS